MISSNQMSIQLCCNHQYTCALVLIKVIMMLQKHVQETQLQLICVHWSYYSYTNIPIVFTGKTNTFGLSTFSVSSSTHDLAWARFKQIMMMINMLSHSQQSTCSFIWLLQDNDLHFNVLLNTASIVATVEQKLILVFNPYYIK